MDCIKRSKRPVRYKKSGQEKHICFLKPFFHTAEPVDKKGKTGRGGMSMGGASTGPPQMECPPRSLVTAETVKVWTWSGGAGGFSDEERRAGGWPGFRKGVVPAGNGKQETPYGDESVRG